MTLRLRKNAGPACITPRMVAAVKKLSENIDIKITGATTAIQHFHETEVKDRAEDSSCGHSRLCTPADLCKVVEPDRIHIDDVNDGNISEVFSRFIFECSWNKDGFAIGYDSDENIVGMGTAAIME